MAMLLSCTLAASATAESNMTKTPPDMVLVDSLSFYIDRHEVTVAAFTRFLNARGNRMVEGAMWLETMSKYAHITDKDSLFVADEGFENHPAVEVSWHGAVAFCEWAGKRLPTEAEWQHACEGPVGLTYPWGNEFRPGLANIFGNADGHVRTAPVGSFPAGASPFGLLDMAGNAWEWTATAPEGKRFVRGGSWVNGKTIVDCASRVATGAAHTYIMGNSMGFRCAR